MVCLKLLSGLPVGGCLAVEDLWRSWNEMSVLMCTCDVVETVDE